MKDKNGNKLKIGDWVLYPWWNEKTQRYDYFYNRILKCCDSLTYVHSPASPSSTDLLEKLPMNKKKREQILLLRKLEY